MNQKDGKLELLEKQMTVQKKNFEQEIQALKFKLNSSKNEAYFMIQEDGCSDNKVHQINFKID